MSKKQITPEKIIGFNKELEQQLKRQLEAVKFAYKGLQQAYAEQDLEFNLSTAEALKMAAASVTITGTREIPQAKRLELLGLRPDKLEASYSTLAQACGELGIAPEDLDSEGNLGESQTAEIMASCTIKAVGADAVLLAGELERAAALITGFFKLMKDRGQNPPNPSAVGILFNGMLSASFDGQVHIVPSMLAQYVKRN
jgi:hypothetical protein